MFIDAFTFFNELDILEVRLNTLKDSFDRFVLVESPYTFAGKSKPLYFEDNKSKFKDFPITHIIVEDMPQDTDRWAKEIFQRNAIKRGLIDLSPNDYIMVSDVDEIPFPSSVGHIGSWSMTTYYYTVNQIIDVYQEGPVSCLYKDFVEAQLLRDKRYHINTLNNQCWHFSFFGGRDRIEDKIHSFSHEEYDTKEVIDNIDLALEQNTDLFSRDYKMIYTDNNNLPKYLLDNKEKFSHWFKQP